MAAHSYVLRSKLNNGGASLKNSPSNSPFAKIGGIRSPRKTNAATASLNLQHVIGATTTGPSGFSCHAQSNTYAYCAGSTIVLAKVEEEDQVTQRFFKARPTASSVNPCVFFYEQSTPTGTPTSRRKSVLPPRNDSYGPTSTGSPFREWSDDSNGQTWTARERIKAASSVSISSDGRLLAVGETGYNPRVLIFSTAEDSMANTPLSIMVEHTFGVRAVAFSPDSKFLATLGEPNDGFLFIWSVNTKSGSVKLHSANRCTASILDMVWCGRALITVGTRHIKAWKVSEATKPSPSKRARLRSEDTGPASPAPQTLTGRNVLLGNLIGQTFTCAVAISPSQAVLCTESGHVCILKDGDSAAPALTVLQQEQAHISCIAYDRETKSITLGDRQGNLHVHAFSVIPGGGLAISQDRKSSTLRLSTQSDGADTVITALGALNGQFVALDGKRCFGIVRADVSGPRVNSSFVSHHDSIRGLRLLGSHSGKESFFTWSASGQVIFWNPSGNLVRTAQIRVDQSVSIDDNWLNELKVVRHLPTSDCYVSGDRLGILKLMNTQACILVEDIRAHASEIIDIAIHEAQNCTFVATSGRDRTVQLFRVTRTSLELVQTLDEHIGAVTQVLFNCNGDKLLSASADRTIVVRDRFTKGVEELQTTAYLSSRVITLKATPLSMTILSDDPDLLIVSAMDRNVLKLTISTGAVSDVFKVTDTENDDTVILSSICMGQSRIDGAPRLLVGCSSTDKSIRVYDLDRETLLTREAGHTGGISEIALREEVDEANSTVTRSIISTGLDGTIMTWSLMLYPPQTPYTPLQELCQGQAASSFESDGTPIKPSPASLPPLRKVLTNMDIAQFTSIDSATGSPIQAYPRSASPSRLRRRTSRLTLAHSSIDEDGEVMIPAQSSPTFVGKRQAGRSTADSPSPPHYADLRKQRSFDGITSQSVRPELRSSRTMSSRTSPSPPNVALPVSIPPNTHQNVANNGRALRRPPSVPTDLRGQAMRQSSRRQSLNLTGIASASDFGSMTMATEQASRMLRIYRTKVTSMIDRNFDWDEVENELQKTLAAVRERQAPLKQRRTASERSTSGYTIQVTTELDASTAVGTAGSETSDVENLRALLKRTSVSDDKSGQSIDGVEVGPSSGKSV